MLRQLVEWLNFVEWEGDFVWPGLCVTICQVFTCFFFFSHREIDFLQFFRELWEADQREKLDASE